LQSAGLSFRGDNLPLPSTLGLLLCWAAEKRTDSWIWIYSSSSRSSSSIAADTGT
ncbi:unnamed protein product, partial [Musa banksii]